MATNSKRGVFLRGALGLALALGACRARAAAPKASLAPASGTAEAPSVAAPRSAARAVKIGLVAPLSRGGVEATRTARLALTEFNQGRKGADKAELVVQDDKAGAAGALEAAESLCGDPGVLAVVLEGEEAACPQALRAYRRAGLAVVCASSFASPRPDSSTATWLCPTQEQMAAAAAQYCRHIRYKQVATVEDGCDTAMAAAKAFVDSFRRSGGKVVFEGKWAGSEDGLQRTVQTLKLDWPQAVFYAGPARDAARLMLAMDKLKVPALLFGGPAIFGPDFLETAKLAAKHSMGYFPTPPFSRRRKASLEAYRAYFGYGGPGHWGPLIFEATRLGLRAVDAAAKQGEAGRSGVLKALDSIQEYDGIRGRVSFGPDRSPEDPRVAVYLAWNMVNSKRMRYLFRIYGPPF